MPPGRLPRGVPGIWLKALGQALDLLGGLNILAGLGAPQGRPGGNRIKWMDGVAA